MQVVVIAVFLVACASAMVPVERAFGYHDRVAIPAATRIKAAEDEIIKTENRNARIVGGAPAKPNAHPYLGGLVITYVNRPNIGVCGSVLVSRTRLLTAAHCWYDGVVQANRFVIVLGSNFLFSGGDRVKSYSVIPYPGWDPAAQKNNIAVIILKSPVLLTKNIQPIALARNPNETFADQWALASGFGFTSDAQTNVPVSSVIHVVKLQVITVEECQRSFGDIVQPNTICTSGVGGVGTCRGDGGGPLVTIDEDEPRLIGINTFGAASGCQLGFPSGFSRVTSFLDFLDENL